MKVTKFSPDGLPLPLAGWSTGYSSIGSNTDSNPPLSALNFVQRITANTSNTLLNPIVNFASGSGISLAASSNTVTISATGGGGSSSLIVSDEGSPLSTAATTLDFVGSGVTASGAGATKTITIPASTTITTKDEGSTLSSSVTTLDFVGAGVTASGAGATTTVTISGSSGSSGAAPSPTADDDEFDVTDVSDPMTGWTTLGTPTTHNINSTRASNYYVKLNATGTTALTGIYKACPSIPFTVTAKVSDYIAVNTNFMRGASLFIAEAAPGKIEAIEILRNGGVSAGSHAEVNAYTNRTTYSSTPTASTQQNVDAPAYLRIVVTSSSNVSYYISSAGFLWTTVLAGRNPGFTVGAIGLSVDPENATFNCEALFDWVRFGTTVL